MISLSSIRLLNVFEDNWHFHWWLLKNKMKVSFYMVTVFLAIQLVFVNGAEQDNGGIIAELVTALINFSGFLKRLFPTYPDSNKDDLPYKIKSYDFIIIGASPSGLALAHRLSENPKWKILVLEAGDEPSFLTDIPFLCATLSLSKFNWGYRAEKQEGFCRGCIDESLWYAHGKVLGGSSVINYMIYSRGNKRDYDKWCEAGNFGWCYDDVLPYFLKLEDAHIKVQEENYHHSGGLVNVSDVSFRTRSSEIFVEAAQTAGYPYVDYNGKEQFGVSYMQSTTGYGRRWSAEKAYLRPIRKRKNLTIRKNVLVSTVLINNKNNTAYGVNYIKNGRLHQVNASKEVIVSAGGLNSPQILILSGIGPADHLEELEIPQILDLPVGKTMYDHAAFPGIYFTINDTIGFEQAQYLVNPKSYTDFLFKNKGPFTSIGGLEGIVFMHTNVSDDTDPKYPDVELIFAGGGLTADMGIIYRRIFNINKTIYDKVFKPSERKYTFTVIPVLVHPKSKGYVKLRSKNINDAPKFFANLLSDQSNQDVKAFISSIREIQRIAATPNFRRYNATIVDTKIPGCESYEFNSDDYWECALRTIIGTLWHQVGTCRMGSKNDPEAVVDHELRVHGMKNLRVVDVSIMPSPITGHTVGPAYMIGEKAADMLKNPWEVA